VNTDYLSQLQFFILDILTPHITGSKKQSEERAALFPVRVHVIVGRSRYRGENPAITIMSVTQCHFS
jgi:hypothetical protein